MDREEYLAKQRKELWRIKNRIILLLIAAVTFVVLTVLALIIRGIQISSIERNRHLKSAISRFVAAVMDFA